jgi:hypothetical protein
LRTYLGYIKVPQLEGAFDLRNLLTSTALDPTKPIVPKYCYS